MKVLADMHVAPPLRRWLTRLGLAVIVAIAIGYLPGELLRRDPKAAKLERQLEEMRAESRVVAADNQALYRQVEALRTDVGAVEARARADLGMVYPDEIVLRVRRAPTIDPAKALCDSNAADCAKPCDANADCSKMEQRGRTP